VSPQNDPKLWTLEGIADALDETSGEMGIAVAYGYVCLGSVYQPSREAGPFPLKDVRESGDFVELWGTITVNEVDVRVYLIADAARTLKPGQRFEVRKMIPSNYGRTFGMAWYRNDAMDKRESWGRQPLTPETGGGYYLVGEYVTPRPIPDVAYSLDDLPGGVKP
jgi:hypothetical protein